MTAAVETEISDSFAIVRFARPAERNPLSIAVLESLHHFVDEISGTGRRIVFAGSEGVFASGANLREIARVTGKTARAFALRGQTLMDKIAACDSTAAVNGLCFGGAFDLALACRRRIASPLAEFAHPGGNLGIMTGWGGTQRLPRLIGEALALEIFLTGRRVGSLEALRIGLVDAIDADPLAFALTERCA